MPKLRNRIDHILWGEGLEKYGVAGRIAATILRYLYALVRDMFAGQLMMRSMSLVYTTLLSIVPLIAFSLSVLKGFGIHNQLEPWLFRMAEPLGPQGAEIAEQLIELVDNVRGGVLGGISLAFFIYTAISMVQKVEESFNYVWYVAKRRNFARRIIEYAAVILIAPVVMVIAVTMIASLESSWLVERLQGVSWIAPVIDMTGKLTPYALIAGVFTFLYRTMPNTRVHMKSALVGGAAGGFIWATISVIFATFVVTSTRTLQIYSGFAVAITALIWLYLNWLTLLIGSQLAFYHQNPAFLRMGHREPRLSNAMRERLALNIMFLVGKAFRDSDKTIDVRALARVLKIPSITLTPIIEGLEADGLLTSTEKEMLLPGREMSRILVREILATVREHGETGSYRDPRWTGAIDQIGAEVDAAVAATVGDQSLAELLDDSETGASD